MPSTELVSDLFATCRTETVRLLDGFDAAPTRSGLFDVGAVAEIVALGDTVPGGAELRSALCDAAASWLRRGLLEEFAFTRVELAYYSALLAYLAQSGRNYRREDMAGLKRLCEGRLIGRGEMPVLNQKLTATYLTNCGIDADFGDLGQRDLARMVDKRVLRPRSDEYDLLVVLMCAQLFRLDPKTHYSRPSLYPHALLVQAVRAGNTNWLPVLSFLCEQWFSLDALLRDAACQRMRATLPSRGELVPAPPGAGIDSEYIGRAGRGLRIRSTIALAYMLSALGDSYDEDRANLAFA